MRMKMIGGSHLNGVVTISGSKNAAGPLIAASVLFTEPVVLTNVPRLTDVGKLLDLLVGMGASVEWLEEHTLRIDPRQMDPTKIDRKKMKSMRYSILLLGPMLARFQRVFVPEPGGCNIGSRPIDEHIQGLQQLGAEVETDEDGDLHMSAPHLKGGRVIAQFSVTATENILMAAVFAKGTTQIRLAAAEPHVQNLCHFLNACGAKITGIGSHDLDVQGVTELHPPKTWAVSPDTNEIATFAVAAAITHGEIEMPNIVPDHLDALFVAMSRANIAYEVKETTLRIKRSRRLRAFKLQTMIYPGFPTDNQAPFGLLATQCQGTTLIHDPLFESRLGYLNELGKMGANIVIADPHRAVVNGPTPLHGTEIRSLDLRAGATMLLAGLIAEGETIIHDAEMVYRGYERLDERLRALGADIVPLTD